MTDLRERGAGAAGAAIAAIAAEAFRARALGTLLDAPPDGHDRIDVPIPLGDHVLNPHLPMPAAPSRRAAVLIPVVARPGGATLLLTRRTDGLPTHAGQVAFPGGKVEPCDDSPLACALREAREEIGLDPAHVEPLGYLDLYQTRTGFRIVPTVALVAPDATLTPDASEVAALFEVPLAFLMDPANHRCEEGELRGVYRKFYAMPFGDHYIWGVTAGIIRNLYDRVYG